MPQTEHVCSPMPNMPRNRTEKRCPRCGETKPLDEEHFYRVQARGYRGGYRWSDRCKQCTSEVNNEKLRERLARDPDLAERQRTAKREWKRRQKQKPSE